MKRIAIIFTVVSLLLPVLAQARDCNPPAEPRAVPSGTVYELELGALAGASEVRIEESRDGSFGKPDRTLTWQPGTPAPKFTHWSISDEAVHYRITAFNSVNPGFLPCTSTDQVTILADPVLRTTFRRAMVPVVGSVDGANGSHFRTSMTLLNSYFSETLRGRLIFHPAGVAGDASDRSLTYSLPPGTQLHLDDLVTQFGASGLGSLDVVPDDDSPAWVPVADVQIRNVAADGASYGMSVPLVRAADFYPAEVVTLNLSSNSRTRTNVGVRTLDHGGKISIDVIEGRNSRSTERQLPGRYFAQMTIDELVGFHVEPPAVVRISGVSTLIYGTETDNSTNDSRMRIGFGDLDELTEYVGEYFR